MNELQALRALLASTFDSPEAWHGPPVMQILHGIDASTATASPALGAFSILTLVGHMTYWRERVLDVLDGVGAPIGSEPPPEENFPVAEGPGEAAWESARRRLQASQQALLAKLDELPDETLWRRMQPGGSRLYEMLHGLINHDLYHCGQIALLRKTAEESGEASSQQEGS